MGFISGDLSQRIGDCRDLYLRFGGASHELIEREMRALGHADFHRRVLYRRNERGRSTPGWIETYGFDRLLRSSGRGMREESDPEGVEQRATTENAAPLQGADAPSSHPGVPLEDSLHPRLLSVSPSATGIGAAGRSAAAAPHCVPANPHSSLLPSFEDWLKRVSPGMTWDARHQQHIYEHLERVTSGECKRLMIFMPPRHGKSELVTVRYGGWRIKRDPSMNIIIGSYNQRLANRFSRKIRRVLAEDHALSRQETSDPRQETVEREQTEDGNASPSLLPHPTPLSDSSSPFPFTSARPKNSEAEWETRLGGGLRAVGVGSGVTGFGANLIIVDDPVKSRAEAESATFRDNVWQWFNDDLYTRLEPDGAIILIQTRWHEDDLAGRLLRESEAEDAEQWEVINLPALAEGESEKEEQGGPHSALLTPHFCSLSTTTTCPLGRKTGEALWPERFSVTKLEDTKRKIGSYSFAALYQQRPVPAGGGLFKREWFRNFVAEAPAGLKWKRGYDLASTASQTSDYSASYRVAFDREGRLYIDGGWRRRVEYPEQRRFILGRILAESDTEHGIEQSANGTAVVQDLLREPVIRARALRPVKVTTDKVTRALPWLARAEQNQVILVRGPWNEQLIEEAATFPQGLHDDQIDAISIAVRMHERESNRFATF